MEQPANTKPEETLWDAEDVARFLKLSESWVYHEAEKGLLPCIRLGRNLRFDPDAIRAYARGAGVEASKTVRVRRIR